MTVSDLIGSFVSYVKQTWENSPSTASPLSADRLNYIEGGIQNNSDAISLMADVVANNMTISSTNVSFVHNSNEGNLVLRKYGNVVTATLQIILNGHATNETTILDVTIPEEYIPAGSVYFSTAAISGVNVLGVARVRFNSDGKVQVLTNISDAQEIYTTATWLTTS